MFCPKCGSSLPDDAEFCEKCGSRVDEDYDSKAKNSDSSSSSSSFKMPKFTAPKVSVPKIKMTKKLIAGISVFVVIVIATVSVLIAFNTPSAKMNRYIKDGDIIEAYEIYSDKLDGKKLSDKTVSALKECADGAAADYESGSISYNDAKKKLSYISKFSDSENTLDEYLKDVYKRVENEGNFKSALENGNSQYSGEYYLDALKYYKAALELREDSEEAKAGIAKSEEAYVNEVLKNVDGYIKNEQFSYAESALNQGLKNVPENAVLLEKLNGIVDSKIKSAISQADKYIAERNYSSAADTINSYLRNYPDNAELKAKLAGISETQVNDIVTDAYGYTESGDWDKAVEVLESAKDSFSSNEKITNAYDDIKKKMPITLKNINYVSSNEVKIYKEVIKDRYGNIYDGGVRFRSYCGNESFALVTLGGAYTTFKGKVFVSENSANGRNYSLSFYLDNELVLFKDGITEETAPTEISLNVSGKQTLKIVAQDKDSSYDSYVFFGDTEFVKVSDSSEEE